MTWPSRLPTAGHFVRCGVFQAGASCQPHLLSILAYLGKSINISHVLLFGHELVPTSSNFPVGLPPLKKTPIKKKCQKGTPPGGGVPFWVFFAFWASQREHYNLNPCCGAKPKGKLPPTSVHPSRSRTQFQVSGLQNDFQLGQPRKGQNTVPRRVFNHV